MGCEKYRITENGLGLKSVMESLHMGLGDLGDFAFFKSAPKGREEGRTGRRVTVDFILNRMTCGAREEEILEEYKGLTKEDISILSEDLDQAISANAGLFNI